MTLAAGSFPGGSPNNVTLFVDGRNKNLGKSITRGIDFTGRYRLDTSAAGRYTFAVNGTYLTKYDLAITGTAADANFKSALLEISSGAAASAFQFETLAALSHSTSAGGMLFC